MEMNRYHDDKNESEIGNNSKICYCIVNPELIIPFQVGFSFN